MFRPIRRLFTELNPSRPAVLLIVLIGAALRIYRLGAQSFWYDEGNSARIAERSLQLIIAGAAGDIHPPLYYILLHYWRALSGETEFALRMFSVMCGVGLIVFTYLLARRLYNLRVGLIAAALMALSPFAIYYSQEARMYILLALEAAVSTYALMTILDFRFWILDSPARPLPVGESKIVNLKSKILLYILATAAGLYTQYAYPFVMVAQGVGVLVWLVWQRLARQRAARESGRRWQTLAVYAAINVGAIVLFAPWLPIAIRQVTSWSVSTASYDLGQALLDAYRWLVVGRTLPLDQAAPPLVAVSLMVIIGIAYSARRTQWLPALLLALLIAVPFGLLFVFHLYREAYLKFLLVCVAPLLILAARGVDGIATSLSGLIERRQEWAGRTAATAMTLILVVLTGPSLDNLYANPAYARDDYRGIARAIEASALPGDAVLLNAPNQWEVFTYYHRQGAPAIPLVYRPSTGVVVDQQMQSLAAQYTRLFVLYYGEREADPSGIYERWLAEHAFKADERWIGNIRMAIYATQPPTHVLGISAVFGDGIQLASASVDLNSRQDGEILPLRLTWQARNALSQRYKVFVHVGQADMPPVAQNDSEPVAGLRPTDGWKVGEPVIDQRGVWLKPGIPLGRYGIYLGVYDSATGKRLPIRATGGRVEGDRLWLGDVTITQAP